jgi:gamma-glutamylcyclotransferase (GGCT)/AIG2-like uncharacterized protein YtfP
MRGYELHRLLVGHATFLGEGHVKGALLELHGYPGLVDGEGTVRGELYRLRDAELLHALDREEGYNFERRRAVVTLDGGRRARAWVYRYRGPRERARTIADGDYRRARPPAGSGHARTLSPGRTPWR